MENNSLELAYFKFIAESLPPEYCIYVKENKCLCNLFWFCHEVFSTCKTVVLENLMANQGRVSLSTNVESCSCPAILFL